MEQQTMFKYISKIARVKGVSVTKHSGVLKMIAAIIAEFIDYSLNVLG